MSVLEIIGGILMLVLSIVLIIVAIMQPPKQQDMSSAVTGNSSSGNFYGKNGGTSREGALANLTRVLTIAFFVITLAVNIIGIIKK